MIVTFKAFDTDIQGFVIKDVEGRCTNVILSVGQGKRLEEFIQMLNGYLNTRPESPEWMFNLVDTLQSMPERHRG